MIRRPPRSTLSSSSAASDVYKRQMVYSSASTNFLSVRCRDQVHPIRDPLIEKIESQVVLGGFFPSEVLIGHGQITVFNQRFGRNISWNDGTSKRIKQGYYSTFCLIWLDC